jgi:C4-type Zn-finger protein
MKKLSPNIKLGCPKCGNSLELDTTNYNFNIKFENKVTTITGRNNNKKSSKVISLF